MYSRCGDKSGAQVGNHALGISETYRDQQLNVVFPELVLGFVTNIA